MTFQCALLPCRKNFNRDDLGIIIVVVNVISMETGG